MSEETIFAAALALPPEQRAACLDQACGGDTALRRRVEVLLNSHAASDFLEAPAAPVPAHTLQISPPVSERPGDRIGRYKLLQQIGEGGCGVVYMAEQDEPVQRRVALKVIKLGMDTKQVIARFEAERQALALMDHPNIAKVLDGGATETGRPYFVMELVRGIKITEFCDHNNLPTRERLELFMQVCRAIQHAHQKGIIHRDIKPSNILVTINDGVPVPKVIDFGIAKATQGRLTDKTLFTAFEQFIGTPAYMSPEQAVMTSLDIDTRSDIYSLGVLLYELLTGKTPFDSKELLEAGLDAMRRTIQEKEPERPSTKLSTMVEGELTITAKRHQTEPPKLISSVRGDLDWIVMKCLEKDRARRYETANGLASDLQRHLDQEPVTACPPSNLYRFQKLLRRNKLAFAAAGAVAASLLIGLGISTWMFFQERAAKQEQARLRAQAEAQEQKALTEAAKSAQVSKFLKDMLEGVGPGVAAGRDTTLLGEILDKTAERVAKDLKDQPLVQAELWSTVGRTYHGVGRHADAGRVFQNALEARRRVLGNEHADVATSLSQVACEVAERGEQVESEAMIRQALKLRKRLLGQEHVDVADSLCQLGILLQGQGKQDEAGPLLLEALAMRQRLLGKEHPDVATSLHTVGNMLRNRGKLPEAEAAFRQALDMRRRLLGKEFPGSSSTLASLAGVLANEGKAAEAEGLFREAVDLYSKVFGEEHELTMRSMGGFADLLEFEGKHGEAELLYQEYIKRTGKLSAQATAGNFDDWVNANRFSGWILATSTNPNLRDGQRAIAFAQRAVAATDRKRPNCLSALAAAYAEAGQFEKAVSAQKEAMLLVRSEPAKKEYASDLHLYESNLPCRYDWVPEAQNDIAWMLASSQDSRLRNGVRAVELAQRAVTATDGNSPEYLDTLAAAYAEVGQFDNAVCTQQQAMALLKEEAYKSDFACRLRLYESHSPYRSTNDVAVLVW